LIDWCLTLAVYQLYWIKSW